MHEAIADSTMARLSEDAGRARGLPNAAFTSEDFYHLEQRQVFGRGWTFAAAASDLPERGDAKPIELAGRPLFLIRGSDGEVRVFHNVCPHRGARIVAEEKKGARSIVCPYHAWAFDTGGRLKARPHYFGPGQNDTLDRSDEDAPRLRSVRSKVWHDWVFVNLDGLAPDFEDFMAPAISRLRGYDLGSLRRARHITYGFDCNWKLAVENFCDVYHVFKIHPALDRIHDALDRHPMQPEGCHIFNGYRFAGAGRGLTLDPDGAGLPDIPNLSAADSDRMIWCALFPNASVVVYPSNVELILFEPAGVARCVMHMWFYLAPEAVESAAFAAAREKLYEDWISTTREDEEVCRLMQEGRHSEAFDGGRLAPYWDIGTVHFHRQIAQAIRAEGLFARP